ncbi:MAG: sigma-70 family RNA polymerase sigma factor [Myxococcales bacterium]|nr:sigma-70 family RNA polymerase sigma factor [Myxococcales bacterium]
MGDIERFLAASGTSPHPDLAAALEACLAAATEAHPDLRLDRGQLIDALGSRVGGAGDPVAALAALHAADLYLVVAARHGDTRALAALDAELAVAGRLALSRLELEEGLRQEVVQTFRSRLADDEGSVLDGYAGRGPLRGWLRTALRRMGLNRLRGEGRRKKREEGWFADYALGEEDPELDLLKDRYRGELEEAIKRAFERLAQDQRELLRLYVIEGNTLDQLAAEHGVNPSTVSRWLARIRDKHASDARRHFAETCALAPSECESLVQLVRSNMHVSVERLLAET